MLCHLRSFLFLSVFSLAGIVQAQLGPNGATASFKGSLPPKPTAALSAEQEAAIEKELALVKAEFESVKKHVRSADAAIFLKAVRYALDFNEWYDKKPEDGVKKANALLDEAKKRIAALKEDKTPWMEGPGQKVLGFYSGIDASPQPYGVEIPEDVKIGDEKIPMWVWLHGRGDTATDLHFVYSRLMAKKPGQFQPKGSIVIHPFGRYCNGWKSAGETDVFECRNDAADRFNVDENRIALAGFSMGGAGAWHIGAHYADQWACVHTGAGFVDVKRYQKLTPDKYPTPYEQTLWNIYDVPAYARNFLNVPLISYSGELDAQRDSADYMTEVLAKEGITRPHLIGPGMGHKYHPESIKEVQSWIEKALEKGRDPMPKKVVLQTRSQRYTKMFWVTLLQAEKPFEDTRIEAEIVDDGKRIEIKTTNVIALWLDGDALKLNECSVSINGQAVREPRNYSSSPAEYSFTLFADKWSCVSDHEASKALMKGGGSSMEDGLLDSFTVVLPEKSSGNAKVDAWVKQESEHFIQRWRSLMRGDPIIQTSEQVLRYGFRGQTVVLWGTPESNPVMAQLLNAPKQHWVLSDLKSKIPCAWNAKTITVGTQTFDAANQVLVMAYPYGNRNKHQIWGSSPSVILNTGLTFREAHDKTNSLQNPKLPDWAILDITQPANAESAGKVIAADFFDSFWQAK